MFSCSKNLITMAMVCHLSVVALAVVIVDASPVTNQCPPLEREGCETKLYHDGILGKKCEACALKEGDVCNPSKSKLCPDHTTCSVTHGGESQFDDVYYCIDFGIDIQVPEDMDEFEKLFKELYGEVFGESSSTTSAPAHHQHHSSRHNNANAAGRRHFRRAVTSFANHASPCRAHQESLESHRRRIECDLEGFYLTTKLQCWNKSQCWCVSRSGKLLGKTFRKNSSKRCGATH